MRGGVGIERRDGDGGDATLLGDVAAELGVFGVVAERVVADGQEVGALRGQDGKAQGAQTVVEQVALGLEVGGQGGEVGVGFGEALGYGALEVGGRGEGQVLVGLGN